MFLKIIKNDKIKDKYTKNKKKILIKTKWNKKENQKF